MPQNDEGRFANDENEDNSIDVSNEAYVGVDPEYRNAAYPTDSPLNSENPETAALEERARNHGQTTTGIHGYTTMTEDKQRQAASRRRSRSDDK